MVNMLILNVNGMLFDRKDTFINIFEKFLDGL